MSKFWNRDKQADPREKRQARARFRVSAGVVRHGARWYEPARFRGVGKPFKPRPMSSASSEHPSLEVGDRVGDLGWVDHDGNKMFLGQSTHAGRVTVLFVCRSLEAAAVQPDLAAYRRLHGEFRTIDVQVFAVAGGSDAGNAAARLDLPFPVLSDPGFSAARAGTGPGQGGGPAWAERWTHADRRSEPEGGEAHRPRRRWAAGRDRLGPLPGARRHHGAVRGHRAGAGAHHSKSHRPGPLQAADSRLGDRRAL